MATQTSNPSASISPAKIRIHTSSTFEPEIDVSRTPERVSRDVAPPGSQHRSLIDNAKPLPPESFPNPPRVGSLQVPATIPNVRHLLERYGIVVRYNVIRKKPSISIPNYSGAPDNSDSVALSHIMSLATLNGMATGTLASFLEVIGDQCLYNPVADWITSKAWDGCDRLRSFYQTLVAADSFPASLKQTLMYRWLISAVAAVLLPSGFRSRGVLTLQGPQSIGKTTWISSLIPDAILREGTIKLDHHLDAGNKDSLLTAIGHWIVEIGELDSSFKKDIARLKGFLTADRDKVRRPYGRTDSEYPRRTVFCATVNDHDFLVDMTGNSRWWTIPVTSVNFKHGIDMQQVFAQVAVDFEKGEPWWLTDAEEAQLDFINDDHRRINATQERVLAVLDTARANAPNLKAMTPTEVLQRIGITNPTNTQCKDCAVVLRRHLGDPKKIRGQNRWRVPLISTLSSPSLGCKDDDDVY